MVNRKNLYHLVGATALVFVLFFQAGCTKNNEQQVEEKGKIEQMTDKAAEKAVKKIRTPMDKASATQNLGDERLEAMDKALQKQ